MCWTEEGELTTRQAVQAHLARIQGRWSPSLPTIIFGYCKKEVKTQIGTAQNLSDCEEEHAGGRWPSRFNLGDRFVPDLVRIVSANHRFAEVRACWGAGEVPRLGLRDRRALFPRSTTCRDTRSTSPPGQSPGAQGAGATPKLLPARIYIHRAATRSGWPKHTAAPSWADRDRPEGAFCHKPCTVSAAASQRSARAWSDAVLPGSLLRAGASTRHGAGQAIIDGNTRTCACPRLWGRRAGCRTLILSPIARRLGDQAAHAQSRGVHAGDNACWRAFRTTWCTGVRDQALLPPRVGRRLAEPLSASTSCNGGPGHDSSTRGDDWLPTISGSDDRRTAPGEPTKLRGLRRSRQSADGGDITASVVVPARRLSGCRASTTATEPEAGGEL